MKYQLQNLTKCMQVAMMTKEFKLCLYRYLYFILASTNARGCLYVKKSPGYRPVNELLTNI